MAAYKDDVAGAVTTERVGTATPKMDTIAKATDIRLTRQIGKIIIHVI
jgi:hypothetical protein